MNPNVCTFGNPTLPTANQYVILFDSTRSFVEAVANSTSLAATAGSFRGRHAYSRLDFFAQSTTQDVTLVRQIWDSTAWQTVSGGSDTLTAGTLYPYGWVPEAPDYRIYMLAGGTAPATFLFRGSVGRGDRASGS